jgi:hypothetical protein
MIPDQQCAQLVETLGRSNTEPDACVVGFASWLASAVPESPAFKPVPFVDVTYLFAASPFSQITQFGFAATY